MSEKKRTYQSYLLRFWQDGGKRKPLWRASLQSTLAGEIRRFADVHDLCTFLKQRIAELSSTTEDDK